MTPTTSDQRTSDATILVVEDDRTLADLYADVLSRDHRVVVAYTARAAAEQLAVEPDVVLLDRRLPDGSGEAVLDEIGRRGIDCRVALVTAVEPDVDVIDLGVDDYLCKPVEPDELRSTVDRLIALLDYDELFRQLTADRLTRNLLIVESDGDDLEADPEFQRLQRRIAAIESELVGIEGKVDHDIVERARTA